jgi:geranylgeranyl diphosphate synthase type I
MLSEELKKNLVRIEKVIREDDFPDALEPRFLREAVVDYPLRGGKRIRSALLCWTCGLLGGDIEKALYAAASVEIYHNWTLVHDDIIDDDDFRRGELSTHVKLAEAASLYTSDSEAQNRFGRDFAILAGDIQHSWSLNMLLRSAELGVPWNTLRVLLRELQTTVNRQLVSGEALDVEFAYRNWDEITTEEIEKMLTLKTGALLAYCAAAGGLIALETDELNDRRVKSVSEFALKAGTAFQLRDDWLGIFADEETLGKPIASDIIEGKPSILFKEAISSLPDGKSSVLKSFLRKKEILPEELATIKSLIRESGADCRVSLRAERLIEEAKSLLADFQDNKYKKLLYNLADYMLSREL